MRTLRPVRLLVSVRFASSRVDFRMSPIQRQPIAVARHDTFHIRDGWLLKGLNAIEEDPTALSRPDAQHGLGVGKNMVSSIRYWLQATGLAIPSEHRVDGRTQLKWTTLARFIVERDPYLEDIATLWLLHLELSSARDVATFWYWAFNECDAVAF